MTSPDPAAVESALETIHDRVSTEATGKQNAHGEVWTSRERLRMDGVKPKTDYEKEDVADIIDELADADKIIDWHGLLAPATDEHLRAIIDNERAADVQRQILIGRCNELMGS